jgi:hypothetical protein
MPLYLSEWEFSDWSRDEVSNFLSNWKLGRELLLQIRARRYIATTYEDSRDGTTYSTTGGCPGHISIWGI